jgi:hypothetical protein
LSSPDVLADDEAGNAAYYGGLKQMHKSGEAYKLSSVSDMDWMTMAKRQTQLEDKVLSGTGTDGDARNLAMTYEVMDAASQEVMRSGSREDQQSDEAGGGKVVAGGASPASQAIIVSAVNNRRFSLNAVPNSPTMEKELLSNTKSGVPGNVMRRTRTTGPDIT